jgi:serine/threonine protein kinase
VSLSLVEGTMVADRFRLVRPLGQGGMGAVWVAHHISLDIPCAIKFLHNDAAEAPEMRARFEREAKSAAQFRSPHVVQIIDHGTWLDTPYIVMEYLEGEDLAHRLRSAGRLDAHTTVVIAGQVARALNKAHAAGLVHRDLKPANIFLVHDEDREIAKVLDFGIAKSGAANLVVSENKTKTGAMLGTPYYMSPEQAQGTKKLDHRSDLWSLAVVIFQCITGKLPFESDALGDLLIKIIIEPLPVPSEVAPVPPGFDAWWARAVARDPAKRFQTAKELVEALALALGVSVPDLGVASEKSPDAAITPSPLSRDRAPAAAISIQATTAPGVSVIAPPHRFRPSRRVVGVVAALTLLAAVSAGVLLRQRSSATPAEAVAGATSASPGPLPEPLPEPPNAAGALPKDEAAKSVPPPIPLVVESAAARPPRSASSRPVAASATPPPATAASSRPVAASATPPPATAAVVQEPKPPVGQGQPPAVETSVPRTNPPPPPSAPDTDPYE